MTANTDSEQNASGTPQLFEPLALGGLTLINRIAVAPMTRVSAGEDGSATPRMSDYYGAFAQGGFGLVITEGIYTDEAWSQGYLFQPGLANDDQRDAWRSAVERVHAAGGRIFAQLMHAARYRRATAFGRTPGDLRPCDRKASSWPSIVAGANIRCRAQ